MLLLFMLLNYYLKTQDFCNVYTVNISDTCYDGELQIVLIEICNVKDTISPKMRLF